MEPVAVHRPVAGSKISALLCDVPERRPPAISSRPSASRARLALVWNCVLEGPGDHDAVAGLNNSTLVVPGVPSLKPVSSTWPLGSSAVTWPERVRARSSTGTQTCPNACVAEHTRAAARTAHVKKDLFTIAPRRSMGSCDTAATAATLQPANPDTTRHFAHFAMFEHS